MTFLYVAIGGALGAVSRYSASQFVRQYFDGEFPIATLLVNVIGCLLLGLLAHIGQATTWFSPSVRAALGIGFLGALTTFSTFGYETLALAEQGNWRMAALNVALNLIVGLIAVFIGIVVGRVITG